MPTFPNRSHLSLFSSSPYWNLPIASEPHQNQLLLFQDFKTGKVGFLIFKGRKFCCALPNFNFDRLKDGAY